MRLDNAELQIHTVFLSAEQAIPQENEASAHINLDSALFIAKRTNA